MGKDHDFRPPVFVRKDDETQIEASVVVWSESLGGVSVRVENGEHSILIRAEDWPTLVGCINRELERVA